MIKWRNSAFHNHDTVMKRKLLGGVSFDGGGAGGAKGAAAPQAGVQTAQPSFSPVSEDNLFGLGLGIGLNGSEGIGIGTGTKQQGTETGQRDTVSIHAIDNPNRTEEMGIIAAQQMLPANAGFDVNNTTHVIENVETKKRHSNLFVNYFKKMKNSIQTFLRGAEQKAGREKKQSPEKKKTHGTRAITKEEFYEMQADTGYLLDSYNKYGERSTLGKP